jgi:hypothetical protein
MGDLTSMPKDKKALSPKDSPLDFVRGCKSPAI